MILEIDISDIEKAEVSTFVDMLTYVSEYIYEIKKEENKVLLNIEGGKNEEVLDKIKILRGYLNLDEVKKKRDVSTKVLENHTDKKTINKESIFEKLIECGSIVEMSDGAYGYSGIFLKVFRYFNRKIEEFGHEMFEDIIDLEDSILYPVDEYERGLYFESFPHHLCFETNIKSNVELLDRFSKNGISDPEIFSITNFKKPENILRHAACVPIYPMLKNKVISEDKPVFYLVSGKCFRNEDKNISELARLNEFYMKEYVCIGTLKQTLDMIEKAKKLWNYWIEKFDLNCTIQTANDSFFANNYKKLKIFQIMGNSKQELKVNLPHNNTECAVSSANVHRTHFTKTYNIHSNNSLCMSSCFAFGIERLSYALLCQKGIDIDKWDDITRKEILGE
ncbi:MULTISPECIES: aminoacyl--tRNA ligase-related protein [Lachnospiraceae]|jgi:hypothetical protein|uniref:tRNA synthetase class II core domain (G, H, P, S and T) n=1 Tax=Lachnobacterium bovis DSM 14045 TaxID=1122142 RepID=A0A1H3L0U3_9FIRM|nr:MULTISPECIES: aminoacyl--tRNA ligase-related protein [Lachnospiraceae]SDY57886.1 tRNA synthetase class II core domain (G, H, P, S and T) [Lachnobacterium bovis DSM 14045]